MSQQTTKREEVFIVDIFFRNGTKLLNVEVTQATLDFYSNIAASERPVIVFDQTVDDDDIFEKVPDPTEEDSTEPPSPVPDQTIPPDAVTIAIPNASYTPSPTPMLGRIMLKVVTRLAAKSALIKDPWLFIQVNTPQGQNVKLERFQLKPQGIVLNQDFVFDVDTNSNKLEILVTMFEGGAFPISEGRRITVTYKPDALPPTQTGGQISPLLPILGAMTAIAFISDLHPKKKRRR